jgi:thiosulfate/3-mercaptopyruvate sulfurtransferase
MKYPVLRTTPAKPGNKRKEMMVVQNLVHKLFTLIIVSALVSACTSSEPEPDTVIGVDPEMGTLVTSEWLSQHLNDPDIVVLDCTVLVEMDEVGGLRTVSGQSNYEGGHIPSAGFANLTGDLSNNESPYEFSLLTPEQFGTVMGKLGVGDNSRVVLYDSGTSAWAARVWWMLRWIGFDKAALLDGGLGAWTAEGRPLSTEPANRPVQQLTVNPRPELIADHDEVFAAIDNDAVKLIDALPESHFRGDFVLYERSGHIPGASNVPASTLLDESGHYRPYDELAALFDSDHSTRAITYCGGGISASSNAFIMTRLGFTDVAVYISSLQEWANDFDNPLVEDTP